MSGVQYEVRSTGRRESRDRQRSIEEETRGGTKGTKAVDTCTVLYQWAVQVICTSTYMQRPPQKTLNDIQDSTADSEIDTTAEKISHVALGLTLYKDCSRPAVRCPVLAQYARPAPRNVSRQRT